MSAQEDTNFLCDSLKQITTITKYIKKKANLNPNRIFVVYGKYMKDLNANFALLVILQQLRIKC